MVKVLKIPLCFIIWYLVAMEIRAKLFLMGAFFVCMMLSAGPINVCTDFEINRYKIDEFRKHTKIVCFMFFGDLDRDL